MENNFKFRIGETISLELEASDPNTGSLSNIRGYEFMLMLYTDTYEPIIMSTVYSSEHPEYLKVGFKDDSTLYVGISSSITKRLRPGISRLEIKAKDVTDNWRSISVIQAIEFLPSKIAFIDEP